MGIRIKEQVSIFFPCNYPLHQELFAIGVDTDVHIDLLAGLSL